MIRLSMPSVLVRRFFLKRNKGLIGQDKQDNIPVDTDKVPMHAASSMGNAMHESFILYIFHFIVWM